MGRIYNSLVKYEKKCIGFKTQKLTYIICYKGVKEINETYQLNEPLFILRMINVSRLTFSLIIFLIIGCKNYEEGN